jgi:enamine deaminase RidA (YjgF/YER057c/UK114 family)
VTFEIVNPERLGRPSGYNNGMLAPAGGRVLFIAGQTARDPSGAIIGRDIVDQWEQALGNLLAVLEAAGGEPGHIGRMNVYVTDRQAYRGNLEPIGEVHRRLMGRHYPAMALLEVAGLADDGALVEIEATAVLPA